MGSSPSLFACVAEPPQAREGMAKARRRIGEVCCSHPSSIVVIIIILSHCSHHHCSHCNSFSTVAKVRRRIGEVHRHCSHIIIILNPQSSIVIIFMFSHRSHCHSSSHRNHPSFVLITTTSHTHTPPHWEMEAKGLGRFR